MPRYDVFLHYYGRKVIQHGVMQGCVGFANHDHEKINPRPVGLKRAQMLADGCVCHAQVVETNTANVVYQNGKPAGLKEGWLLP